MEAWERIAVAMDVDNPAVAYPLVRRLSGHVGLFKAGLQFIFAMLAAVRHPKRHLADSDLNLFVEVVGKMSERGGVFLDTKFHDIPNTVAAAAAAIAAGMNVRMFNLHCLAGPRAMADAKEAVVQVAGKVGVEPPKVLGVTILTSHSYDELVRLHLCEPINIADPEERDEAEKRERMFLVKEFAVMAQESGLDGVVASVLETKIIREVCGPDFLIANPGIRLPDSKADDQRRVGTPAQAIINGGDILVVGRPILQAQDPVVAADEIAKQIEEGLAERAA